MEILCEEKSKKSERELLRYAFTVGWPISCFYHYCIQQDDIILKVYCAHKFLNKKKRILSIE